MKVKTIYMQQPSSTEVVAAPNGSIVYLRENIEQITVPDPDGGEGHAYQCDEYFLSLSCSVQAAEARVAENPEVWLAKAKAEEEQRENPEESIKTRVTGLERAIDILLSGEVNEDA